MTLTNWMHRRNGMDEAQAQTQDFDEFPQFRELPRSVDPVRRQWRQKVMEAGQYVEELEAKVAAQAEEIGVQRNQIRLFEEAQRLVRRQLGDLQTENGKLRDALSRTQTKLQVSGQLVLQALDELSAWRLNDQQEKPIDEPPPIALDELSAWRLTQEPAEADAHRRPQERQPEASQEPTA